MKHIPCRCLASSPVCPCGAIRNALVSWGILTTIAGNRL